MKLIVCGVDASPRSQKKAVPLSCVRLASDVSDASRVVTVLLDHVVVTELLVYRDLSAANSSPYDDSILDWFYL
jgi:hypothetical protein